VGKWKQLREILRPLRGLRMTNTESHPEEAKDLRKVFEILRPNWAQND